MYVLCMLAPVHTHAHTYASVCSWISYYFHTHLGKALDRGPRGWGFGKLTGRSLPVKAPGVPRGIP